MSVAQESSVDVLGEVLATSRAGASRSVRTEAGARFALAFPAEAVAGFHVVVEGEVLVRLDPVTEAGWVRLRAGDVALLPHGAAHVLASAEDEPVRARPPVVPGAGPLLLCGTHDLTARTAHPLLARLPELVVVRAHDTGPSVRAALALLHDEVRREAPGASAARAALVDLVLVQLLREQGPGCASGFGAAMTDPRLGPVLRAVHARPAEAWTVASLARVAALSRSAFARRFTALVGEPPLAYLTRWRLDVAARTLRAGDAPVAAVARSVGYTSPFAFSRAFTRAHGTPPGRWRSGAGSPQPSEAPAPGAGDGARGAPRAS